MKGRPSKPPEDPPRRQGGRFAWLVGTVPGAVAIGFLAIAVAIVVIVLVA